jgi:hypothetical protein
MSMLMYVLIAFAVIVVVFVVVVATRPSSPECTGPACGATPGGEAGMAYSNPSVFYNHCRASTEL